MKLTLAIVLPTFAGLYWSVSESITTNLGYLRAGGTMSNVVLTSYASVIVVSEV